MFNDVKSIAPRSATPVPRAEPSPEGRERRYGAERALWTMVGIGLLWASWRLLTFASAPWGIPFMVLGNLWGMAVIVASWLPDFPINGNGRLAAVFEWGTAVVTLAVCVVSGVVETDVVAQYGTDALAFNQYAAELARQGVNPYVHSLAHAFALFDVRPRDYTYTFTGAHVTALSYPALSFLVYVPLLALGWTHNLAPLVNVYAWGVTAALMFLFSPRRLRAVVLLFSGFGIYAVFAGGGVTDVLFMPLLTVAAYRWDRFGSSRWSYAAPVCFGLAMAIKQTPWTVLPFLLIALALDQSRRTGAADGIRRAGRYLAVALLAFAIPNLPYLIASPGAWIRGVLTPVQHLVPTGEGMVTLSVYLHMGGGSLTAFTLAAALMYSLALVAFVGTYPVLRTAAWVLPGVAFLFSSRSNINYFAALIPAGYVAVTSVRPAPPRSGVRGEGGGITPRAVGRRFFASPRWALACAALGVAFVVVAAYSVTAPAPLVLRLSALETAGRSERVRRLTLQVRNRSGTGVRPVFAVLQPGPNTGFWRILSGPRRLASGRAAQYTLLAPGVDWEPSLKSTFSVIGFVASPASFSVSDEYDAALYGLAARRRLSGSHSLDVRFGAR